MPESKDTKAPIYRDSDFVVSFLSCVIFSFLAGFASGQHVWWLVVMFGIINVVVCLPAFWYAICQRFPEVKAVNRVNLLWVYVTLIGTTAIGAVFSVLSR